MAKIGLSNSEMVIMNYLWDDQEAGGQGKQAKDIIKYCSEVAGKGWGKQTVNTFLTRMIEKGYIIRIGKVRKYDYQPAITRSGYIMSAMEGISGLLPNGADEKVLLFMNAVLGIRRLSEEEKERLFDSI